MINIRDVLSILSQCEENDGSQETRQKEREGPVKKKLKVLTKLFVTSPSELREVRQDKFRVSVKVDFFKKLSEHLEE